MKKHIILNFIIAIILFVLIIFSSNELLKEILSTERKIIVKNQESDIVVEIKEIFNINKDIKEVIYYDSFDGFDICIYDENYDEIRKHIEKLDSRTSDIEQYFLNIKKEYNRTNIIILLISIFMEIYIISRVILSIRKVKNIK